ncbi:TB2/DP1, HVA22 family-domain-containing protein [Rhodocollybia butyracea]|uniref:Protein YOP1 n=1 Tax=Rhodocollybia butyracea TaxID=206335 RepID=A0A9P5QAE3_9AGAR|nr:TB2/DP1, HVA22 family-domain-containing protein [Rhodocollybia butyracea]
MLFNLISRLFSSILTYLYPAYISYKLLSTRPTPLPLLERALKYWCVLGTFTFFESSGAELFISWIPFYGVFKLLVLAYLVLPQTEGTTHVYDQILEPWFSLHETEVDGALDDLRKNVYEFVQTKLRALWELLLNSTALGQAFPSAAASTAQTQRSVPPPTMADPVSGPAQLAAGLWRSYGPNVLATGAALYKQFIPVNPQPTGYDVGPEDRPVSSRMSTSQSIIERRRQLEAELAALGADEASAGFGTAPPPFPVPQIPSIPIPSMFASSSASSVASSTSSSPTNHIHGLRERTASNAGPGGRFEEINPNDLDEEDDSGVGHEYEPRPGMPSTSRSSWFSWGGGGSSGGYERVKSD